MRRAFVAALLALGGCAPQFDISGTAWAKSGAFVQQTTLDEMECARLASRAYWTPDLILGGLLDVVRVTIENAQMETAFSGCMRGKGYQRTARS